MEFYIKPSEAELTERKLEAFLRYSQIIQWGRKNPVKYCERFYGIEFLDHQKYIFMSSWVTKFNLWCKSRGAGKTTLIAPFVMAKSNLYSNHQTYIMAGVGSQSQEAFRKIESIAKKEIASFVGLTDFFLGEIEVSASNRDGFIHNPGSFSYKLFNGSKVNSLNGAFDHNRSKRSNLNVYDESGFAPEELFSTSMPFITQDADFQLGAGINLSLNPKRPPNQAILASSASDMTTYFYRTYKDYAKKMIMGDKNYFVADIDANIVLNATYNGKIFPSLLSQDSIDQEIRKNKEKAMREFYNKFSTDGGDKQPIKRSKIKENSRLRLPELQRLENFDGHYAMAYDPARQIDNAVILIGKFYQNEKYGWMMDLVNGISLVDVFTRKKIPMRYPEQTKYLQNLAVQYNGLQSPDYEYVKSILIDSGAGGGGRSVADYMMEEWTDNNGIKHHGMIDKIEHKEYLERFPLAVDVVKLMSPLKYKVEMFDSLIEMINLGLITFTEEYDGKDYLTLFEDVKLDESYEYEDVDGEIRTTDIDRQTIIHDLSFEEQMALNQIDLTKEELYNIYRYDGTRYSYDLAPDKKSETDDRAYCMAMLGWYLKQLRKNSVLTDIPITDYSSAPLFTTGVNF